MNFGDVRVVSESAFAQPDDSKHGYSFSGASAFSCKDANHSPKAQDQQPVSPVAADKATPTETADLPCPVSSSKQTRTSGRRGCAVRLSVAVLWQCVLRRRFACRCWEAGGDRVGDYGHGVGEWVVGVVFVVGTWHVLRASRVNKTGRFISECYVRWTIDLGKSRTNRSCGNGQPAHLYERCSWPHLLRLFNLETVGMRGTCR